MTVKQWEKQFKLGLASLPESEQERALEFFSELYNEKTDRHVSEEAIVAEFGDPWSAARKIVEEYYAENAENRIEEPEYAEEKDFYADYAEHREKQAKDAEPTAPPTAPSAEEGREKTSSSDRRGRGKLSGLIALLCVLFFFVLGACFGRWATAWLVFLLIPILTSLVAAVEKRNANLFVYPVLAVAVFLAIGLYFHVWHPTWIVFLTIPLYYTLLSYFGNDRRTRESRHNRRHERRRGEGQKEEKTDAVLTEEPPESANKGTGVFATVVFIVVIVLIWLTFAALISGSVTVIGYGTGLAVNAAFLFASEVNVAWATLGAGIALIGVGMALTVAFTYLIRPFKNLTSALCRKIKGA